jgi:hypothetical protein
MLSGLLLKSSNGAIIIVAIDHNLVEILFSNNLLEILVFLFFSQPIYSNSKAFLMEQQYLIC